MVKRLLSVVFTLALLQGTVKAQFDPALASQLQGLIDSATATSNVNGLGMAAIMPDGCTWEGVSGLAGPADSVDFIRKWHWASLTKTLTATTLLQLHEEGKLDINDSIGTYLDSDTILYLDGSQTVKQFMNHTTDLANTYSDNPPTPLWTAIWSARDSVWHPWNVLKSPYAAPAVSNPNDNFRYLGLNNYLLLGFVIESATGNRLDTEFQNRIFTPLGMSDSYLGLDGLNMNDINGVYKGTNWRGNLNHDSYMSTRGAAAALMSSPMDVAVFLEALFSGQLLSSASMALMQTKTQTPNFLNGTCIGDYQEYYGLGISMLEVTSSGSNDTLWAYGHAGIGLSASQAYYMIDSGLTITLASNDFDGVYQAALLYSEIACLLMDNLHPCAVGMQEKAEVISRVYPNPGTSQLSIELADPDFVDHVELLSVDGRLMLREIVGSAIVRANTADLPGGVYIIRASGLNGQWMTKWVKH